jgi:hypothetical protein
MAKRKFNLLFLRVRRRMGDEDDDDEDDDDVVKTRCHKME